LIETDPPPLRLGCVAPCRKDELAKREGRMIYKHVVIIDMTGTAIISRVSQLVGERVNSPAVLPGCISCSRIRYGAHGLRLHDADEDLHAYRLGMCDMRVFALLLRLQVYQLSD